MAALLSLGSAGIVGAVFAAWAIVAVFEILMAGRDRRRAVSAERARAAEPPPDAAAPDMPAVAIVAEPGEAPPPLAQPDAAADVAVAPGADSQETHDDPHVAAATDESEAAAPDEPEWPPVSVARGAFEPVLGAPDAGPLPVPPPLAVPPRDDPTEDER